MAQIENLDDENGQPENQQRERKELLGVIYGIGMNVNSIIGVGIFTTPGIILSLIKKPYVILLLWLAGGIVSLFGSLIYTEYGALHRDNGGEKIYLDKAYPSPPFMASYLFSFMFIFVIRPVIICAVLQSAAQYTWFIFVGESPFEGEEKIDLSLNGWKNKPRPYWILKLVAILYLLLITGYHLSNRKLANKINHTLAITKMVMIVVIAFSGISKYNSGNWNKSEIDDPSPYSYPTAILNILFSYTGWNTLNYSLDEFKNPQKRLKLSNIISIVIVIISYILVNIAFISAALPSDFDPENRDEVATATFFRKVFVNDTQKTVAKIFSFFIVLSAIGTAAINIWSGSRVIVSAAESNFFPIISPQLKKWKENTKIQEGQGGEKLQYIEYTPVNALLVQFVWCIFIILIIGASIPVDSFVLFSSISTFSYWIFFIATGWGLVRTRKRSSIISPFKVPRMIIYLFEISGLLIIILSFFPDKDPKDPNGPKRSYMIHISFIWISIIFLLAGFASWYFLFREKTTSTTIDTTSTHITDTDTIEKEES
ncbi:amino acid/polyamine transporter I [Rhizophagus diaphanus]|nr:amino acid/polyamine transporter I [Rhizophagus diaphanus] [Rhizophagus sp. MUCL 43196]